MKDSVNVYCECMHPICIGDCIEPARDGSSCRMNKDIETTKLLDDLIDAIATNIWIAHITF
jgi:hypothetical protein